MKHLKVYLIVMAVLLLGAVGAGVYVWFTIQTMNRDLDTVYQSLEQRVEKQRVKVDSAKSSSTGATTEIVSVSDATSVVPPLPVTFETLTPEQRERLESFSVGGEEVVITPVLVACASKAVGEQRLGEIVDGSAPSPLELTTLLPCLQK